MKYVERLAGEDVDMVRRIEDDLLSFRNHSNHFGRATARLRETQLQPVSWWEKYGNCAPTLVRIKIQGAMNYSCVCTMYYGACCMQHN